MNCLPIKLFCNVLEVLLGITCIGIMTCQFFKCQTWCGLVSTQPVHLATIRTSDSTLVDDVTVKFCEQDASKLGDIWWPDGSKTKNQAGQERTILGNAGV